MDGVEGLSGVGGGKSWGRERYQVKIMWPNLEGVEEAPATAKRGEDMNVRAAWAMGEGVFGMMFLVWGMRLVGWCWLLLETLRFLGRSVLIFWVVVDSSI